MKDLKDKVQTITADNGKEFAGHEEISRILEIEFYFAHPYHSWERGLNENTNGLILQYFPKGMSFDSITDEDVAFVMDRLNNRPRKSLDYATPDEVFLEKKMLRSDHQSKLHLEIETTDLSSLAFAAVLIAVYSKCGDHNE